MSDATFNPVDELITYTGYYALNEFPGGFVLVDTNLIYDFGNRINTATITISIDGVNSSVFAFAGHCSFDGRRLIVRDSGGGEIASLNFYKDPDRGLMSAFTGGIDGMGVSGQTPFNPILLPEFAADYYPIGVPDFQLSMRQDYSVFFRLNNGDVIRIDEYSYNYAMFVIQFAAGGQTNTFEMGTAMGYGRVAGNSAHAGLLVSIQNVYQKADRAGLAGRRGT